MYQDKESKPYLEKGKYLKCMTVFVTTLFSETSYKRQ